MLAEEDLKMHAIEEMINLAISAENGGDVLGE